MTKTKGIDPILVAVLDSRILAICEEMGVTLMRTSRSPIFCEARDFAVGIFTRDGRLVAQREFNAVLAGAIPVAVKSVVEAFKDNVNEGDVFFHNDCYAGNNHLPDMNVIKPVFHNGKLAFWTGVKGHMADTGGVGVAGYNNEATTIWDEGLTVPICKLYEKGELKRGIADFYYRNVKVADICWGDLMCMVGGVTIGERRLQELAKRHGVKTLYAAIDEILAATEKEMRNKIRQIPDGEYYGEKATDHDGISRDKPVTIRAKVIKRGDEVTIDLSDSDPQTAGYVNNTYANAVSCCRMAILYALPGELPRNEGTWAPIKIVAPEGTVANARYPAPVACCTLVQTAAIGEAILLALAPAMPQWIAPCMANIPCYMVLGYNPRTKRPFVNLDFFMRSQGSGGTEGYDGWDLGGPFCELGGGRDPDLEIVELAYPIRILERRRITDSAGAGKFRGGMGDRYRVLYLVDVDRAILEGSGLRECSSPSGLFGGKGVKPNIVRVYKKDGTVETLDVHVPYRIKAGEIMELEGQGAPGFGAPYERDIERVLEDVRNELVSVKEAKNTYGVVINSTTMTVDILATEEIRKNPSKVNLSRR